MHIPNVAKEDLQTPFPAKALAAQDREPELAGDEAAVEQFVSKGNAERKLIPAESPAVILATKREVKADTVTATAGHPSQTSTFAEKMANLSSELQDSQTALRASEKKTAEAMSRLRQSMKDWGCRSSPP